jgi:hypothetical protein
MRQRIGRALSSPSLHCTRHPDRLSNTLFLRIINQQNPFWQPWHES